MTTLYHYSDKPFEKFDTSKCDGIWLTDIKPSDTELLSEIGAAGMGYVATVEVDLDDLEPLVNGDNYDVEEQLKSEPADYIHNIYDGFEDYAFASDEHIKSIEWSEL